jgi:hypothetical protein
MTNIELIEEIKKRLPNGKCHDDDFGKGFQQMRQATLIMLTNMIKEINEQR